MATLSITKTLTSNIYGISFTLTNISAFEEQKLEDFGEPALSLGGVVNVTSDLSILTLDSVSGINIGMQVSQSGATGTVLSIETSTNKVYVENVTGTFAVGSVTIGSNTYNITAISSINRFEHVYGVQPVSTQDFTVRPIISRKIPSGLPISFEFNAALLPEAEQNALDYLAVIKVEVAKVWQDHINKTTLWVEGTEEITI